MSDTSACMRRQCRPVRRDADDAQFLKMLHSMDDASIPLEKKWEAISMQMSSKEEFRCAGSS